MSMTTESSYVATVCPITVRPHPNADKILLGVAMGSQVVVGLETQTGDLGVYFPADGQLSEEFVLANNLYSRVALEKLGKWVEGTKTGFFDHNRRVRCQKFRGEKSEGFWVPVSYLAGLGDTSTLIEGFQFTELNGVPICNKYVTERTKQASLLKVGKRQRENLMFPKHDVTKKFKFYLNDIPENPTIYITEKLHGTSGRYGYVMDDISLPRWKQLVNSTFRGEVFPRRKWSYLNGSKNVILEKTAGAGWYGTNEFRYKAIEGITLKKGEILYFEIVGSFNNGERNVPIMEPQPVDGDVKDLVKTYGPTMNYTYNTTPGVPDIYVYKIVMMNEDGFGVEYSWNQLEGRCKELGLKTVPLLHRRMLTDNCKECIASLTQTVDNFTEGPSVLDNRHIREGVVLRIESPSGIEHVKNKSWTFGVLEGYIKDKEEYVDMEESS